MSHHDIFSMYSTKGLEYLIAVVFLFLFIPFWRFVNGAGAAEPAVAWEAPRWVGQLADWFRVPAHVYFHPGHAWATVGDGDLVTVGMDDFARKLVGPVSSIALREVGARVAQGEKAWTLVSDGKSVDMLSPVDGTVVAVNEEVARSPERLGGDPYGEGWLMRVRAPRLAPNMKQLLSGALARRFIEDACDRLQALTTPDLGRVYQDGGLPVDGMARALRPGDWDRMVRAFFLT